MEAPVHFLRPICAERGGGAEHVLHPLVHPSGAGAARRASAHDGAGGRARASRGDGERPFASTSTWSSDLETSSCSRTP
jgi:hypothetical protein